MDRGAWEAAVHGVAEGRTRQSNFTFTFHFHALEKEMATHSSVLAWSPRDGGAWWAAVYEVAQSRTRLKQLSISSSSSTASTFSNMKITLYLPSGHTLYIQQWLLQDNLYLVRAGLRRRQCDPTPVLLPGKSHGQRSLEGCSP